MMISRGPHGVSSKFSSCLFSYHPFIPSFPAFTHFFYAQGAFSKIRDIGESGKKGEEKGGDSEGAEKEIQRARISFSLQALLSRCSCNLSSSQVLLFQLLSYIFLRLFAGDLCMGIVPALKLPDVEVISSFFFFFLLGFSITWG